MAFVLSDRVKETTTTTGTGDVTLGGAVTGFEAFSARMSNGDTTRYCITDGTDWEVGIGTWSTGGTLTRSAVLKSSNSDSAVSFASGTKTVFMDASSDTVTPPGTLLPFAGRTAPTGYLLCYGQAVSRSTYPALFQVVSPKVGTFTVTIASPAVVSLSSHGFITGDSVYLTTTSALPTGLSANTLYYVIKIDSGTFNLATSQANAYAGTKINTSGSQSGTHSCYACPYGLGDGSTTFNVPDIRGRSLAGADAMGGTAASRLTLAQTQGVYGNLGASGGEQGHTLTATETAAINYKVGTAQGGSNFDTFVVGTTSVSATQSMGTTAGGGGHNNIQPTLVSNYIIKT